VLLLETIRDIPENQEPPPVEHRTAVNPGLETMYNRERQVEVGDCLVPLAGIADYVALHNLEFHTLNFNALNRTLAVLLARLLHVEVSSSEIEQESQRFRQRNGLEDGDTFTEWLAHNNVALGEFDVLMKEAAMCRSLHRWLIYARFAERTTRLVLDQLRWENHYQEWAARAANQQLLLDSPSTRSLSETLDASTAWLVESHQEWTGVQFDTDPLEWAEEAGFHNKAALKLGLARASVARQNLLALLEETLASDDSETTAEAGPPANAASEPAA
jgi:hypothetical protein